MSKPTQTQSQEDLQAIVTALLGQLKKQSAPAKTPTAQSWVERHLSAPKSLSEIIWRICWLLVIPGIYIRLWLPISDWCWKNALPLVTLFGWLTVAGLYLLVYHFAINSDAANSKSMKRLIDLQFSIPPCVVWFVLIWETFSHAG